MEVRSQDSSSRECPPLEGEEGRIKNEEDVRIEEFGRRVLREDVASKSS